MNRTPLAPGKAEGAEATERAADTGAAAVIPTMAAAAVEEALALEMAAAMVAA